MLEMKDVMTEIYKEFPEIDETALDLICRDGLAALLKAMRNNEDIRIYTKCNEPLIFFKNQTPQKALYRLGRKRYKEAKFKQAQNGKESK